MQALVHKLARTIPALSLLAGMGLLVLMHAAAAKKFSTEDFGLFSVILTAAALSGAVLSLGIPATAQRLVSELRVSTSDSRFFEFVSLQICICIIAVFVGITGALILYFGPHGSDLLRQYSSLPLVFSSTVVWLVQRNLCLGSGSHVLAIVPRDVLVPVMVLSLILVVSDISVLTATSSFGLFGIFTCLIGLFVWLKSISFETNHFHLPSRENFANWLTISRRFLLTNVLQMGLNGWDILLLGMLTNMSTAGIYAAASRFASMALILMRIANTFYGNRFASLWANKKKTEAHSLLKQVRRRMQLVVGAVMLLGLTVAPIVLNWFGDEFKEALIPFYILLLVNSFIVVLGPNLSYLNMIGDEKFVSNTTAFWSVVSICANILLIPYFGLIAALIVYCICNLGLRIQHYKRVSNVNLISTESVEG